MTRRERAVEVKRVPPLSGEKARRTFMREIEDCTDVWHCRMVLDCSGIAQFDRSVVYLLLCCLEAAMKHNGEIRLANLPAGAEAVLEQTGARRLFDIYDTIADAVRSFHRFPATATVRALDAALPANDPHKRSKPA